MGGEFVDVEVEVSEFEIVGGEFVDVEVDGGEVDGGEVDRDVVRGVGGVFRGVVDVEVDEVDADEATAFDTVNAIEVEDGGKVEKNVETTLWIKVVDASVTVISFTVVAVGTTSSKAVETTASVRDVDIPVIVESVVMVAVGTRQAIVPS